MDYKRFFGYCYDKVCIQRSFKVALLIGTVLALINHFDMFMYSDYNPLRIMQILLTFFVPFFVSLHGQAMYRYYSGGD